MTRTRREFLLSTAPGALALLPGCGRPTIGDATDHGSAYPERAAHAKARAADYLVTHQEADGAWRSDTYGTFKDGTALTPLVLNALLASAPDREGPVSQGADYLAAMARPDGGITSPSYGFDFALYTAALTVSALSHPAVPSHRPARDDWLAYLEQRQLTEDQAWKPADRAYGGWGYARGLPRKPGAGELIPPLTESNLSATTFALDALRAAGVPANDTRLARALVFVRRCQNWNDDPARRDPAVDDGGFFFIYDDPVRNKAGSVGSRYRSYGSATADGLRCLAYCGVAESDPRREAARAWLLRHFRPAYHPGDYPELREPDRMAVYFYYAASMARAPAGSFPATLNRQLNEDVLRRQREDGSWLNPVGAVREDEPIIATSFALLALA
jgi:squalene-hopene/tetraprenyl-beta-curcumene cyclase